MRLTGTVASYPEYLAAAAAARRVAGVTGVHNHLQIALPDGDLRDDAKLTTAASNALAGNVTVPDTVKATAADGHVYLTGTVAYGTERAAAEAAVTGLTGVRNVIDDIEISYVIDPVDVDLHVQRADHERHHHADRPRPTWAEHNAAVSAALIAQGSSTSAMKSRSPADRHHRGPPRRRLADLGGRHDRQGRSPRSRGPAPRRSIWRVSGVLTSCSSVSIPEVWPTSVTIPVAVTTNSLALAGKCHGRRPRAARFASDPRTSGGTPT